MPGLRGEKEEEAMKAVISPGARHARRASLWERVKARYSGFIHWYCGGGWD